MRELVFRQAPARSEVLSKFWCLLYNINHSFINRLLVSSLGSREGLLGFGLSVFEKLILGGAGTLHGSPGEVGIIDLLINLPS